MGGQGASLYRNQRADAHPRGARNAALHGTVTACLYFIRTHNEDPARTPIYGLRLLQNACNILHNLAMLVWQDDGSYESYVTDIKDADAVAALTKLRRRQGDQEAAAVEEADAHEASYKKERAGAYKYMRTTAKEALNQIELPASEKRKPTPDEP